MEYVIRFTIGGNPEEWFADGYRSENEAIADAKANGWNIIDIFTLSSN